MTHDEMLARVKHAKAEEARSHAALMAAFDANEAAQLETHRAVVALLDATGGDEFGPVSETYGRLLREQAAAAEKRLAPHGDARCGDAACGCSEARP